MDRGLSVEEDLGAVSAVAEPLPLPRPAAAALVFLAAGAVLMLEILAVRLLAPYVGLTLEATTAIIGAALAGIAAGAAIGGYLADRTDTRRLVVLLLIIGGLLSLLTVPVVRWLGPGARGEGELAALGITLVALVPAAAVLSAVSPAIAHIQLRDLRASGTTVGGLSAWATAGALVGTFGTGFVLVPLIPVSTAVFGIGATLVIVGIVLGLVTRSLPIAGLGIALIALAGLGALLSTANSPCEIETRYHCVYVEPDPNKPGGFNLLLDDDYHSYVDVNNPTYLVYPYTKWMAEGIDSIFPPKQPLNAVAVGGGGFTLPLWLRATRPGSKVEVLEVDGELVEFVERKFGFSASEDLKTKIGDARLTILELKPHSADVVIGDAYSNDSIPWQLATTEWLADVERVLDSGGVYVQNILDFRPLELAKAEVATALKVFKEVRLVTFSEVGGSVYGGSLVLFASNRPLGKLSQVEKPYVSTYGSTEFVQTEFDKAEAESFAGSAEALTDDFAPADQLLTPE